MVSLAKALETHPKIPSASIRTLVKRRRPHSCHAPKVNYGCGAILANEHMNGPVLISDRYVFSFWMLLAVVWFLRTVLGGRHYAGVHSTNQQ